MNGPGWNPPLTPEIRIDIMNVQKGLKKNMVNIPFLLGFYYFLKIILDDENSN